MFSVYQNKVHYTLCLLLLPFSFTSFGKTNTVVVDSLKSSLSKAQADTQRVRILLALAKEGTCDDTASKLYYLNRALTISQNSRWGKGILQYNLALGNIYFNCMGNPAKAITYVLIADSLARENNDNNSRVSALNSVAFFYKKTGGYAIAIDNYRKILELNPNLDEEIGVWGNIGAAFNSIGDYNKAINAYYSSLKALGRFQTEKKGSDLQDTIQMAGLLLNIGDIYLSMAQPDKAFYNYDSVYRTAMSIGNIRIEILGLIGIGKTYQLKGNLENAIETYLLALQKCKAIYEPDDEVKILTELANSYLVTNDQSKAMEYAQSALKLAQAHNYEELLPKVYITLGKVNMMQKEYSSAVSYLQQALTISQKTGAAEDEKDTWDALSKTYGQMKDPAKAYDAFRHYITIRDSVYNIAKANEFTRQELDFGYKSKQMAEKLDYDKKIARQQMLTYSGFAGLVLVLLLSFFIYRNYHTQKKYNELLSHEKQGHLDHIEAQDTVLMDIAHIQSHKVRGPISTILGLVQLFNHEDPEDPVNKEVIDSLTEVTGRLDVVVKEVVQMENRLRATQNNKKKEG